MNDEDMLGGIAEENDMLGTTPPAKPAKVEKPLTAKKKVEAKAKKAEKAGTNLKKVIGPKPAKPEPAKAKPAKPVAKKQPTKRPPAGPGLNVKPSLTNKQVAVISALIGAGPYTAESLSEVILGKDGNKQTFQKTTLGPLVKDNIVLKDESVKPMTYSLNTKLTGKTPELVKILHCIPTDPTTAITVGFLGGLVWGGATPNGKRDLWVNVRFGRAAGAVLKRLLAIGAIGVKQANDRKPKQYYRNA